MSHKHRNNKNKSSSSHNDRDCQPSDTPQAKPSFPTEDMIDILPSNIAESEDSPINSSPSHNHNEERSKANKNKRNK